MKKGKKIITLIGLMGVGKTTIGKKLAEKLGFYFIDSDQEIEDQTGLTISEIFAKKGEKYFREIERKIISEIIERDEEIILSVGGGAFVNEENRQKLLEKSVVIWLEAKIETLIHRIGNKSNRPLLNAQDKRKTLTQLEAQRKQFYSQSHLKFKTDKLTHEQLIEIIEQELNRNFENEKN